MTRRTETNPHVWNHVFKKNKYFPNSRLPVLVYRKVLNLPDQKNEAVEITRHVFARNGWSNSWSNGIYDFHHYHSNTHECMGICKGSAFVILGGPNGRRIRLDQGDVLILPAGVGHCCMSRSEDFLCVGAYPQGEDYDTNTGTAEEYNKARERIDKLSIPEHDPVLGEQGFLTSFWK